MSSHSIELGTVDRHASRPVVQTFEVGLRPEAVVESLLARPRTVVGDMSAENWATALYDGHTHLQVTHDGVILWTRPGLGQWWYPNVLHVRIASSPGGSRITARWDTHQRNRQILRSMFIYGACSVALSVVVLSLPWTTSLVASVLCFLVPGLLMWVMRPSNRRLLSALYEPLSSHELGETDTEGTCFRRRPHLIP
jgi:hypothetical protein